MSSFASVSKTMAVSARKFINTLFTNTYINQFFLISMIRQLTLSISILLYILVDTLQTQGIQGTLKTVMWQIEERYLDKKNHERATNEETKVSTENEQLDKFFQDMTFKVEGSKEEAGKVDISSARTGRVLDFVRSPEDFYDWIEYVIDNLYGPRAIHGNDYEHL